MPFCITHSRFSVPRESIQVAKPSWNPQAPVAKGQGVIFCVCVCYIYCGPLVPDPEAQNIQSQKTTENQNF